MRSGGENQDQREGEKRVSEHGGEGRGGEEREEHTHTSTCGL